MSGFLGHSVQRISYVRFSLHLSQKPCIYPAVRQPFNICVGSVLFKLFKQS